MDQNLTWKTLEFDKKERHPDWIWTAGFVALIVSVISFFYGNIFFGIFAIIAGTTVIFFALKDPKEISVTIGKESVSFDDHLVAYEKIKKFWIDEKGEKDKLLLAVKSGFLPILTIPLSGVSAEQVRTALKAHSVEESEIPSSRSSEIFDRLGF